MATNLTEIGKKIVVPVANLPSGAVVNDPVRIGAHCGVVESITAETATIDCSGGVWEISVSAVGDSGNEDVSIGNTLSYFFVQREGTITISKTTTNVFGVALGTIPAGQTAQIPVKIAEADHRDYT